MRIQLIAAGIAMMAVMSCLYSPTRNNPLDPNAVNFPGYADGAHWTLASPLADFQGRGGQTAVVFNSRMWIIAGVTAGFTNDVWSSADGTVWKLEKDVAAFRGRNGHASLVYNGKMWVIGGS